MDFDTAISFVLGAEAGYVNDPKDPGGETKYGITKKYYPQLDIANLTLDMAKDIYKSGFWVKCQCDALPDCLKLPVLDMAVNQGIGVAIRCLQQTARVKQDGVLGPMTLKTLNALESRAVLSEFTANRILLYVQNNPQNFPIYGKGWTSRAVKAALASVVG